MRAVASFTGLLSILPALAAAHGGADLPQELDADRRIEFPDTALHRTLAVDLHTHSAFSDGHVWPKIRVEEAVRDGLDALAVTEHLEWQPHRLDIPHADRNRAYEVALEAAANTDLIVINGSEITREMPAGHINAIFLDDANALLREPPDVAEPIDAEVYYDRLGAHWPAEEALAAAARQDAFLFWNHPAWTEQAPDGIARPTAFHRQAFEQGAIHGIEVVNVTEYSEEAFQIALDNDLTLIGSSDVHELIDWDYQPHSGGHRPVTLVFVSERSAEGIREALFARRSVVWFNNLLIGRAGEMMPLLHASLKAADAGYVEGTDTVRLRLVNRSDARFLLENRSEHTFLSQSDLVEVPPHASLELRVVTGGRPEEVTLTFAVLNALVAPKRPAEIAFTVPAD